MAIGVFCAAILTQTTLRLIELWESDMLLRKIKALNQYWTYCLTARRKGGLSENPGSEQIYLSWRISVLGKR